jgi:hypothetical protein
LIDLQLWDRARWKAVLYIWPIDANGEPWIAIAFENGEAGKAIFKAWRAKLGNIDEEERLRVSIITGVDRSNPHHYSVVVGSNLLESERGPKIKQFVTVSRIHRMTPSTSKNLAGFVERFERIGTYRLMPAQVDIKTGEYCPFPELAIQKCQMRICPAWKIAEHDPDGIGIFPDDKPVIPEGVVDPPVLKRLERKNRRTK